MEKAKAPPTGPAPTINNTNADPEHIALKRAIARFSALECRCELGLCPPCRAIADLRRRLGELRAA